MPRVNSPAELQLLSEAQKRSSIIIEYLNLAVLDSMTEAQADRMEQILEGAESDQTLSFLIDEADHIIGHELELIDSERIVEQQETLRERLDKTWVQLVISNNRLNSYALLPKQTLEDAQKQLQKRGLYNGEIDGLCGEKTKEAFRKLEEIFHQELKVIDPLLLSQKTTSQELARTESTASVNINLESITDFESKAQLLALQTWLSTH